MNLQELLPLIDFAINDCERIIQNNPQAVLSESDFERLLSECISKQIGYDVEAPAPDRYSVHTQVSHYKNETRILDARVDILIAKPDDIKPEVSINKNFEIYAPSDSVALELKYKKNNKGGLSDIKKDIDKFTKYKNDSYYYAIVLLNPSKHVNRRERNILKYFNAKRNELSGKDRFFCRIIVKK
jgi:hypothetical protein